MSKRRVRVESGLTPERFQPRASPVDTMVKPPRESKLSQLAQGLSEFNPALTRFSEQALERQAKKQEMEGQSAAQKLIEEKQTYDDAVKAGLIRQDQNPWFRLGMKRQFAIATADRYAMELQAESRKLIEAGADDPEQFRQMESELRSQFMEREVGGNRDAGFDAFFADSANQKAAGIGQNFAAAAGANAVKGFLQATGARVVGVLQGSPDASPEDLGKAIDEIAREAIQEFKLNGTQVNEVVGDALIAHARATGDESVLELAQHVKTGSGTLAQIPDFIEKVTATGRDIDNESVAKERRKHERRRLEGQDMYIEFATAVADARASGGSVHDLDFRAWADRIRPFDRQLADAILSTPGTVDAGDMIEDGLVFENLAAQVVAGDLRLPSIVSRWRSGAISDRSFQQLAGMARDLVARERSLATGGREQDPFRDPFWNDKTSFLRRMAGSQSFFEQLQMDAGRRAEVLADQALTWSMLRWNDYWYRAGGAEASPIERRQELDRIFEAATLRFFPMSPKAQEETRDNNPLDWERNPIMTAREVQELRAAVDGPNGVISERTAARLLRYGLPPEVVGMQNPAAVGELERYVRMQENVYNPPQPEATPTPGEALSGLDPEDQAALLEYLQKLIR